MNTESFSYFYAEVSFLTYLSLILVSAKENLRRIGWTCILPSLSDRKVSDGKLID